MLHKSIVIPQYCNNKLQFIKECLNGDKNIKMCIFRNHEAGLVADLEFKFWIPGMKRMESTAGYEKNKMTFKF